MKDWKTNLTLKMLNFQWKSPSICALETLLSNIKYACCFFKVITIFFSILCWSKVQKTLETIYCATYSNPLFPPNILAFTFPCLYLKVTAFNQIQSQLCQCLILQDCSNLSTKSKILLMDMQVHEIGTSVCSKRHFGWKLVPRCSIPFHFVSGYFTPAAREFQQIG